MASDLQNSDGFRGCGRGWPWTTRFGELSPREALTSPSGCPAHFICSKRPRAVLIPEKAARLQPATILQNDPTNRATPSHPAPSELEACLSFRSSGAWAHTHGRPCGDTAPKNGKRKCGHSCVQASSRSLSSCCAQVETRSTVALRVGADAPTRPITRHPNPTLMLPEGKPDRGICPQTT